MERLGEAGIVGRLVTIRTGRCRVRKLRQVRSGLQIRERGRMTQCTGIVMNVYNHLARMTACCTIAHLGDRGVTQAAAVRGMVIVTMICTGLISMTGGTGYRSTRCNYTGYGRGRRVVMLTVATVVTVTGITAVEVMQRVGLRPVGDRIMTGITIRAVGYLVNKAVKSYVMTGGSSMDRMSVKVSCMTL